MSRENVAALWRFLEHARETPDAVWDIFADDVEWEIGVLAIPDFPATCHGPDGVREFFRRWVGTFEDWDFEVENLIEARDTLAVHIHQWGRGRGSGAKVDQRFWQVWIMRDGKAVRVTHHREKPGPLQTAELQE